MPERVDYYSDEEYEQACIADELGREEWYREQEDNAPRVAIATKGAVRHTQSPMQWAGDPR